MPPSHVVSQGLAEELRMAGWPQESSFYWYDAGNGLWAIGDAAEAANYGKDYVNSTAIGYGVRMNAAPLASELMERMPGQTYVFKIENGFTAGAKIRLDAPGIWFTEVSLPDALTRLALHLIKEGKMKL